MSPARWVFIATCFFIDVRVHAEVLEAPRGTRSFNVSGLRINLNNLSLVEMREGGPHLVRGDALIESKAKATLTSPFATFACEKSCRAIARRSAGDIRFISLSGEWTYRRAGDSQTYALPNALQVRLGEITPAGVAGAEFPEGLPWTETVSLWARLFKGPTAEFKSQVTAFRPSWRKAVDQLSDVNGKIAREAIERHVAAVGAKEKARRAEADESARLRAEFRARNL